MSQSNATTPPSEKTGSSYGGDAVSVGNSSLEGEAVSEKTKSSSAHSGGNLKVVTPDATSGDLPTDLGDTTDDSDGMYAEEICAIQKQSLSAIFEKTFSNAFS